MTSTRKQALALCLALCYSASSVNAQDVTGNLIYSTTNPPPQGSVYSWSGFALTESGGGGLSGGNVPAYNPYIGQFMWGYQPGTINYNMAVGSALSGTGLRITGIQYGLEYFNQDFSRGSLSATWTLRDTSNKTLENYYHTFGYTTEGWTKFDMTKTFATPYSLASVGTLGFSATGQDDRFWAGYYGPQIRDPYARLMYGVDPCATNVLSSPTCPGFADALAKITASSTPVAAESPTTSSVSTSTAPQIVAAPIEPVVSNAPITATATTSSPAVTAVAPLTSTTSTSTTTTASTRPQVTTLSTATVLNNIRSNEQQLQNTVSATVQASIAASITAGNEAVSQTDRAREDSMKDSEAQARAGSDAAQSLINSVVTNNVNAAVSATLSRSATPGVSSPAINPATLAPSSTSFTMSNTNTAQTASTSTNSGTTVTGFQDTVTQDSPVAALTRPGDPTQSARLGQAVIPTSIDEPTSGSSVRNSAPPTQLAGGADFAALSRTTDLNSYTQIRLTDAAFYQPREIYRNQRVIDNARVLRGLGSDRLHQRMVDQQYNIGK